MVDVNSGKKYTFFKVIRYSTVGVFSLLLFVSFVTGGWLYFERQAKVETLKITGMNGIDQLEAPMINGARQWVQIRGEDKENPVILFIHGGPGNAMMPLNAMFQPLWEEDFTVVQWDQRGAGKSVSDPYSGAPIPMGSDIQQYVDDAVEVAQYVLSETGHQKLIVIGHSWGSVVGVGLAQQRPDLLHAYVGTGQVVDMLETERATFEMALAEARLLENEEAIAELEAIQPYPQSTVSEKDDLKMLDIFMTSRLWAGALLQEGRASEGNFLAAIFTNPAYSISEAVNLLFGYVNFDAPEKTHMLRVLMTTDITTQLLGLQVPVVFLEGRHDHITESSLIYKAFEKISSKEKSFHWLEDSGHLSMIQEPELFRDLLVQHVRPYAFRE
ncbi:MAG: alpha/beta hydrolase [Kordiimonadaceae bacterium]|nr:alpha/beta hydrolase [Kordiimonadaceae bacterium]